MEQQFWHDKWARNEIGFHQPKPNGLLVKNLKSLDLQQAARVFVPLCGKTLDIGWLRDQGHHVIGAELSALAIKDLFHDMGLTPKVTDLGTLQLYAAERIEIYVGDVFDLSPDQTGPMDAIYDRAALVALPEGLRDRYADHLIHLSACAPQLLLSFEYDQRSMSGPPFSINADEVNRLYAAQYTLTEIDRVEVPDGLKGICPAQAIAWSLTPQTP